MSRTPTSYASLSQVCRAWWGDLQELKKDDEVVRPRDRRALAELRRIDVIDFGGTPVVDIGNAAGIPAFRALIRRLREAARDEKLTNRRLLHWLSEDDPELSPFAIAAATLARIREDSGGKELQLGATARRLGAPRAEGADKGDRLFAEARFKRLIRTRDDWPDLMRQARRIAAILEGEAPIGDLGASLILWNADPRIIRDWAFEYYQQEFTPADPDEPGSTVAPVTA